MRGRLLREVHDKILIFRAGKKGSTFTRGYSVSFKTEHCYSFITNILFSTIMIVININVCYSKVNHRLREN